MQKSVTGLCGGLGGVVQRVMFVPGEDVHGVHVLNAPPHPILALFETNLSGSISFLLSYIKASFGTFTYIIFDCSAVY